LGNEKLFIARVKSTKRGRQARKWTVAVIGFPFIPNCWDTDCGAFLPRFEIHKKINFLYHIIATITSG
jgi:hypothetical protein